MYFCVFILYLIKQKLNIFRLSDFCLSIFCVVIKSHIVSELFALVILRKERLSIFKKELKISQ